MFSLRGWLCEAGGREEAPVTFNEETDDGSWRPSEEGDEGQRRSTPKPWNDPMRALDHPLRRDILRRFHNCASARSASQLAAEMGLGLSRVSYHVRVLSEAGCLQGKSALVARGTHQPRYRSTVEDDGAVLLVLRATEREDTRQGPQRRSGGETGGT